MQVCGVTYMYRSSFLRSRPEHQIQIVDFLVAYLQSKDYSNLTLNTQQRNALIKEFIDVIALKLHFRIRIM